LRLRAGILLGIIPFILILGALPSTFYTIHTVGPDFRTVGPDGPEPEDETRQLDGEWTMFQFRFYNQTWEGQDADPRDRWNTTSIGSGGTGPNAAAGDIYTGITVAMAAGILALCFGALGVWNIATRDRFRWFTAASFFLAAVLFLGACYVYSMSLPDAMFSDASAGDPETFGALFAPFIDPEGGEPGYYFEFDGGYPNTDPRLREQLEYGPGLGWWMAGAAGIFALIASSVLVAAPTIEQEREGTPRTTEVVRYVPVPTVTETKRRRRYPKRMPAVSRNSPSYKRKRK